MHTQYYLDKKIKKFIIQKCSLYLQIYYKQQIHSVSKLSTIFFTK